jgi:hypothetical protein
LTRHLENLLETRQQQLNRLAVTNHKGGGQVAPQASDSSGCGDSTHRAPA